MANPEQATRGASGSIYRYKTKRGYRWFFKFRDSSGKQSTRRGFRSRREAECEREKLMGFVHAKQVRVSRDSLEDWCRTWITGRKPYLEPGSWNDYRRHGELRILPHLGARKLTALSAPEIRDWLVELSAAGDWAPKTLNNALTTLTVCLNQAVADGLIPVNPAAFVKSLPLGHIERDYLRLAEIPGYLDACSDDYRLLAETLIATGMRISEALAPTVADVDGERGRIVVARSFKDDGTTDSTKSDRFRAVHVGPNLARKLVEHAARRMEATGKTPATTLLFVTPVREAKRDKGRWASNPTGELGPINRTTVSSGWHKQTLADAGLRDMPLHSLRHTAAASWLATGQPLMYVRRQLGHAQITTR
jgi:integrase